jgi:hypothetical protein
MRIGLLSIGACCLGLLLMILICAAMPSTTQIGLLNMAIAGDGEQTSKGVFTGV